MRRPALVVIPVGSAAILLLVVTFLYGIAIVPWKMQPTERNTFSNEQQLEICEKLKFELAPGEMISTRYWPGVMQATTSLTVTIHNINSKEDFLKRVHFETPALEIHWSSDDEALHFDDFQEMSEHVIKDYSCLVRFVEVDNKPCAQIYVCGYITQLSNIYELLYEPWQPYFSDVPFITFVVIEMFFILFLVVAGSLFLIRGHRKRGLV